MFPLHVLKARKRRGQAEPFRIGRVDSRHQRLDKPVEDLAPQPPADEAGQTFVAAGRPPPHEILPRQPQLAQRTQDRRRDDRPNPAGGHQHEALGHAAQPSAAHDQRAPLCGIRADQFLGEPQPAAKIDAPGDIRDEAVGAAFDEKAVAAHCVERAADAPARFEEHDARRRRQLDESMGRGEPGDPAADHGDASRSGGWRHGAMPRRVRFGTDRVAVRPVGRLSRAVRALWTAAIRTAGELLRRAMPGCEKCSIRCGAGMGRFGRFLFGPRTRTIPDSEVA